MQCFVLTFFLCLLNVHAADPEKTFVPIEAEEPATGFQLSSSGAENSDTDSDYSDVEMVPPLGEASGGDGAGAAAAAAGSTHHEELMHCPHYRATYREAVKAALASVSTDEKPIVLTKELSNLLNEDPNNRTGASGQDFQERVNEPEQKLSFKNRMMVWFGSMMGRR
ncbi:MAG: hypothetical protein C0582_02950 [Alphaproteobacteria bacterium]|nr:MAG: hypothetical protein C0582_02950 [Alphaproteobacteria bacterium]